MICKRGRVDQSYQSDQDGSEFEDWWSMNLGTATNLASLYDATTLYHAADAQIDRRYRLARVPVPTWKPAGVCRAYCLA